MTTQREHILSKLRSLMAEALPAVPSEDDIHIPFMEMGANSLVLMEIQRTIEATFGITLVINQFFEELTTIDALATYIDQNISPESVATQVVQPSQPATPPVMDAPTIPEIKLGETSSEIELILTQQLQAASQAISQVVSQQLAFLRDTGTVSDAYTTSADQTTATPAVSPPSEPPVAPKQAAKKPKAAVSPQHLLSPIEIRARGLTERQQRHLEDLIARYTERTKTSKKMIQDSRSVLADSRAAVGFRFTTKEMLYPIVGKRASGSRIWDVDDNEYIDISMGQGVNLFGHNPPFVTNALEAVLKEKIQPEPPRSQQVGEVAKLIAEFTGMDRVTFTNSGTEAVMAALRLARAATGRYKIVFFENSYHGHADNTMSRVQWQDNIPQAIPLGRGIPPAAASDMWILEYGTDQSLEFLRAHAHEIAAVLAEPVQSRRPDLQPQEFLQQVRKITKDAGALLIIDEMITGFRVHPGGAQALFGVKADIATYGKLLGGGLPIGVVAGKAEYMDAIDGGMWQYGDTSYPQIERIAFGGTFSQHPLTMSASLATLKYLKAHSPALQENLNRLTTRLVNTLNTYFEQEEVPISVVHFGSMFRFSFSGNLELLYYHMMEKGVFIWEWRNYFLSTAHSDEDIDHVILVVKESIEEMRAGGFLSTKSVDAHRHSSKRENESPIAPQPLTEAQKQLWALAQITQDGSIAYNICTTLQLDGPLRLAAMRQAVQQVVDRHEALRTLIQEDSQQILSSQVLEVPVVDFYHLENRDEEVRTWFTKETQTPFELSKGPLFRTHILKLEDRRHLLVLTAHHIVVDGMSMDIILQDIGAFYSAIAQETVCQLEPPMQFCAYVQWQVQQKMAVHEAYWLAKFAGTIPVLDLPTDRPPQLMSYRGGRHTLLLAAELCDKFKQFSQKQGCTQFMTFLSVYTIWLHRITSQDDIVVGIPTVGRSLKGSDKLVGYCTHLLPILSHVESSQQSFLAYLKVMRGVLLEAYQHQDYPFANLINKLNLRRNGNHSPLVSAIFNLDRPQQAPKMFQLEATWVPKPIHFTAFDISFNLTEIAGDMVLDCDYNTDLFDASTIERLVGHFQTLFAGIVAHPEQPVAELPLLSEQEYHKILVEWNATKADYPKDKCIHQLIEEAGKNTPDAVAVVFENQHLSYATLNQRANQLAHYLQTLGIKPDMLVGICLERSLEMMIGILGVLKAGGAYLPLDPAYPPARLSFMLEDAQVPVLLTQKKLVDKLPSHQAQVICLDTDWETISQLSSENPVSEVKPSNLAYVIYTSGSTGKPKGTMIIHQGLVNYLSWCTKTYQVADGFGSPVHSSIGFDATITSLFAPLMVGKRIVLLPEEQDIEALRTNLVSNTDWSLVKLTPAHLEMLNPLLPKEKLAGQSRFIILGGDALTGKSVSFWRTNAPETRIINEYGPTETVVGCCVYEVAETTANEGAIPIGCPVANTQLYILDKALQPVPIGVQGELYIGGAGVAKGYLNRPELTEEKFIPNPFLGIGDGQISHSQRLYKTGDLARYLPDSNIEYLGRIDNQVKIRGFRVELGEIENVLTQHHAVRDSAVIVHEESSEDQRLVAYIVPNNQTQVTDTELRVFLTEKLPDYMIPSAFVRLPTIPLTKNGKVDRHALPTPEGQRPQLEAALVTPKTDAEKRIAAIWQDILHLKEVGIYDNFFELGGHSLLIIPMRDQLQQVFNRDISAVDLFKYPTINALAHFMSQSQRVEKQSPQQTYHLANRQKQAYRQQQKLMKNRRKSHG
ncbi:MAG: amino acid adenylation domain-containing protein [Pseudomonadota bacterium]